MVVHYELGEEPEPRREATIFDKPTRGTSVEKFREMVLNHLKVKGSEKLTLNILVWDSLKYLGVVQEVEDQRFSAQLNHQRFETTLAKMLSANE